MSQDEIRCAQVATYEIRPSEGDPYEATHSCDRHIADLVGHTTEKPPSHYLLIPLSDPKLICCKVWK